MSTRLNDIEVHEISFVPKGANKQKKWILMKEDRAVLKRDVIEQALTFLTDALAEANKGAGANGESIDKSVEAAANVLGAQQGNAPDTAVVPKEITEAIQKIGDAIVALAERTKDGDGETEKRLAKIEGAVTSLTERMLETAKNHDALAKALEAANDRLTRQAEQIRKMVSATDVPSPVGNSTGSQHQQDVVWGMDLAPQARR